MFRAQIVRNTRRQRSCALYMSCQPSLSSDSFNFFLPCACRYVSCLVSCPCTTFHAHTHAHTCMYTHTGAPEAHISVPTHVAPMFSRAAMFNRGAPSSRSRSRRNRSRKGGLRVDEFGGITLEGLGGEKVGHRAKTGGPWCG